MPGPWNWEPSRYFSQTSVPLISVLCFFAAGAVLEVSPNLLVLD